MILLPCGDNLGPHPIVEVGQPHTSGAVMLTYRFLGGQHRSPSSPPSRDVARDILLFLQLSHGRT